MRFIGGETDFMTITLTIKYSEIADFVKVLTTIGSMEESEVEFTKGILMTLLYDIQNLGLVYTRVKNIHFSSTFILKINTNFIPEQYILD